MSKYKENNAVAAKKYYQKNKEKILQKAKEKSAANRDKKRIYNSEYYAKNSENIKQSVASYAEKHVVKLKQYHNSYYKSRRKNDINFKLKTNISANISFYLKNTGSSKNNKQTLKYLQYSIEELKNHLESLFEPWMNWENYGRYDSTSWNDDDPSTWAWQIDHIVPHSTFSYSSMEDDSFKSCWTLSNLRPLSAKQNWLDGVSRSRH